MNGKRSDEGQRAGTTGGRHRPSNMLEEHGTAALADAQDENEEKKGRKHPRILPTDFFSRSLLQTQPFRSMFEVIMSLARAHTVIWYVRLRCDMYLTSEHDSRHLCF